MSNNSSDVSDISLSIVEIDEVLKDDTFFCPTSDGLPDDIACILKQWKQNEKTGLTNGFGNGCSSNKYIDTRTFTRPKKKTSLNLDSTFSNDSLSDNDQPTGKTQQTPVNLKVGGLVTSMQGSFIANTTMPNIMENSLINSSDFSNVNFLSNTSDPSTASMDDTLAMMKINSFGYNLADVISDTKFMENLCGDPILKDDNISKTDCILSDSNSQSSGNSTLQNSENFTNNLNETFVPLNRNPNETIVMNETNEILNGTFNLPAANGNGTFCADDGEILNGTYNNGGGTPPKRNVTIVSEDPTTPDNFKSKLQKRRTLDNITPILKRVETIDDDITPIDINLMSTPLHRGVFGSQTAEEADEEEDGFVEIRTKHINRLSMNDDDFDKAAQIQNEEDQRNSLFNFEAFEKSISLLENRASIDEKEFDNILSALSNSDNKLVNERMRQNLDNIKKRHSIQQNLERQQEVLKKSAEKEKIAISQELDSNRLNDSVKSMNSSISSGERLLSRRSRLFDDFNSEQESPVIDAADKETKSEKQNRDRFKTIRIFKKAGEYDLPDADQEVAATTSSSENEITPPMPPPKPATPTSSLPRPSTLLKKSGLSRPKFFGSKQNLQVNPGIKSSSADDLLDRSFEDRRSGSPASSGGSNQGNVGQRRVETLKSPMGVKAKSFHNIAINNNGMYGHPSTSSGMRSIKPMGKLNLVSTRNYSSPSRDINEPKSLTNNMRPFQRPAVPPRPGQYGAGVGSSASGSVTYRKSPATSVRPKSAYYSQNVKRTSEETELSPTSLSSASSRGYYVPEHASKKRQVEPTFTQRMSVAKSNENLNSITTQATSAPAAAPTRPSGLRQPQASGLRQPMVRSGLPRPTATPRR